MKRICADIECKKSYVTSAVQRRDQRDASDDKVAQNLCQRCFRDFMDISYSQSYFGSIAEWGKPD